MNIIIDNYDITHLCLNYNNIEFNKPEFGEVENTLFNTLLEIEVRLNFAFFNSKKLSDIQLIAKTDRNETMFNGFIDKIEKTQKSIKITAKSLPTIVFNRKFEKTSIPLIYDKMYPIEILKNLLMEWGLKLNYKSYLSALKFQQEIDLKFSFTAIDQTFSEILQEIAKKSCGKIYFWNDEIYFEQFNPDEHLAGIELRPEDYFELPTITTKEAFNSGYINTDVKFGNNISVLNQQDTTNVIDCSITTSVWCSDYFTAKSLCDLYDTLGQSNKHTLTCKIKKNIIRDINFILKYEGRNYKMININNNSQLYDVFVGESIENILKKKEFETVSYYLNEILTIKAPIHHITFSYDSIPIESTFDNGKEPLLIKRGSGFTWVDWDNQQCSYLYDSPCGICWYSYQADVDPSNIFLMLDTPPQLNNFSLCFWIKSASTTTQKTIFTNQPQTGGQGFDIVCDTDANQRRLKLAYYVSSTLTPFNICDTIDEEWHFICITSSNNNVKIYADNVLISSNNNPLSIRNVLSYFWNNASLNNAFLGALSDIRFYDYELNNQEIETLYNKRDRRSYYI